MKMNRRANSRIAKSLMNYKIRTNLTRTNLEFEDKNERGQMKPVPCATGIVVRHKACRASRAASV